MATELGEGYDVQGDRGWYRDRRDEGQRELAERQRGCGAVEHLHRAEPGQEPDAGLVGIGTDILTARLRGLEDAGVLSRTGTGRQQRYALTGRGRALRPVLAELGRWGAALLDLPASPDQVATRTGLTTLVLDPPPPPAGLAGVFDICCDGETARVAVRDGDIALVPRDGGPPEPATAVIGLSRAGLLGVLAGRDIRDMTDRGDLVIRGERPAGALLITAISAPSVLAALTAKLPSAEKPG